LIHQIQGEYIEAIDSYDNYIKINSASAIVWLNRGIAYQNLWNDTDNTTYLDNAIDSFNKSLINDKTNSIANYYMALCCYYSGKNEDAIKYFRNAYNSTIYGSEFYKRSIKQYADSYYYLNRYNESVKEYERISNKDPIIQYNLGNAYYKLKKYQKSIDCYTESWTQKGKIPVQSYYNCGLAYMKLGNYDDALNCFNNYTAKSSNDTCKSNANASKGICLAKKGEYYAALRALDNAKGNNYEYPAIRGMISAQLGYDDEALDLFKKSIKEMNRPRNNNIDSTRNNGSFYIFSGRAEILLKKAKNDIEYSEALKTYNDTLKSYNQMNPSFGGLENNISISSTWANRGKVLLKLHRGYEAVISYANAEDNITKETDDEKARIYNGLADALYTLGSYNESMNYYYRAKSLSKEVWPLYGLMILIFSLGIFLYNGLNLDNLKRTISLISLKRSSEIRWDKIPGDDRDLFIKSIMDKFKIEWVGDAEIKEIDNGQTIKLSTENKLLLLKLNDIKSEAFLEMDDGRKGKFRTKLVDGERIIYDISLSSEPIKKEVAKNNSSFSNIWTELGEKIDLKRWPFISTVVQFLAFLLIMANYFSIDNLIDYIIVAFFILLSLALIWLLFGTYNGSLIKKLKLVLLENEIEHRKTAIISAVLSAEIYAVIAGIIFFFSSVPGHLQLVFFRLLLLSLFSAGFLANLPILWVIMSEKVDNDTRNITSLFQSFWLGLNCLYLSQIVWSYGMIGRNYLFETDFIKQDVSILSLGILILFLVFFLLPYLYGWRISKQQRIEFLQAQNDLLNLCSKLPEEKRSKQMFETEIEGRITKSINRIENYKIVQNYMISGDNVNKDLKSEKDEICDYRENFENIKDLDIRFRGLCMLCLIKDGLKEGLENFDPMLDEYKQLISNELNVETSSKPQLWITVLSLIAPIFGQYIISIITRTGIASNPSDLMSAISGVLLNTNY
jgi:tetratricopeptide (TPR) repeat protein